jgi:hypothetical protein
LDDTHSGKQTIGSERSVEIELDRNTDFKDTSSIPTTIVPEIPQVATKQKMQFLNSMLREHVQKLPIVTTASGLPYHGAPSATAFFAWSVGKQKALEWHRAHLLRLKVQQQAYNTMDTVLKTAADAMSTKDVVLWCRTYHYTPNKQDVKEEDESMEKAQEEVNQTVAGYCKFCGGKRNKPQHTTDDHCPTRPKDWNSRKRNAGLNSTTSVNRLLDKLEEGWDEVKESGNSSIYFYVKCWMLNVYNM